MCGIHLGESLAGGGVDMSGATSPGEGLWPDCGAGLVSSKSSSRAEFLSTSQASEIEQG